jgi:hypothetical protein
MPPVDHRVFTDVCSPGSSGWMHPVATATGARSIPGSLTGAVASSLPERVASGCSTWDASAPRRLMWSARLQPGERLHVEHGGRVSVGYGVVRLQDRSTWNIASTPRSGFHVEHRLTPRNRFHVEHAPGLLASAPRRGSPGTASHRSLRSPKAIAPAIPGGFTGGQEHP